MTRVILESPLEHNGDVFPAGEPVDVEQLVAERLMLAGQARPGDAEATGLLEAMTAGAYGQVVSAGNPPVVEEADADAYPSDAVPESKPKRSRKPAPTTTQES